MNFPFTDFTNGHANSKDGFLANPSNHLVDLHPKVHTPENEQMTTGKPNHLNESMYLLAKIVIFRLAMLVFGRVSLQKNFADEIVWITIWLFLKMRLPLWDRFDHGISWLVVQPICGATISSCSHIAFKHCHIMLQWQCNALPQGHHVLCFC